ncbi:hypothetical protein HY00_03395, partial [Peptococcaceae bacterium SCADC1_2_3]
LFIFSILNLRLRDKKILYVALIQTITNLIRLLPVAFGVHSVILIITLALYTRLFTKAQLSKIFMAVLICFAVIALAELTYVKPLLNLTNLTYETAFANPFLRAAFALPYEIILLALSLGKNYYNHKKGLIIN